MQWLKIFYATTFILKCTFASDDAKFITCGSAIKLKHVQSGEKFYLDSGGLSSQQGSGQQMVTLKPNNNDHSSLWLVKEEHDSSTPCLAATPIKCHSIIRLTHLETGKNLHSHGYKSALSNKQEVTCFGNDGEGDESDNYEVICSGKYWEQNSEVIFQHVETNQYMAASKTVEFNERNCGGQCPIKNHLEVFAINSMNQYVKFKADLGVFLSV